MITFARFALLVGMTAFSCLFAAALAYSVRDSLQGGSIDFNVPLFLDGLLWCSVLIGGMVLAAGSVYGDKIAGLFFPIRRMSLREEQKVMPALERVRQLYRQHHGQDIDIDVTVMDLPHINGIALGRKTVALSTGLLKIADDDEMAAIIAHEAGHLHNRDGFFNLALLTASLPAILLNHLFRLLIFFGPKPKLMPSGGQDFGWAAGVVILFMFLMFFAHTIVCWVLSFPVLWLMRSVEKFTEWPIEYRADRFAHELGLGPAMIKLFERIEDEDIRGDTGFLRKYLYSHPPTALRIDEIERSLMGGVKEAA
ncbi:MAG: M48 family metalloprotease [Rhodospirillales bacterium]|nr:M48 family metalloprotease [Rhodospirillales bacterium]